MTCDECRRIRADQMEELFCDNKENCGEAHKDGYNQALDEIRQRIKEITFGNRDGLIHTKDLIEVLDLMQKGELI